ncbi:hypothetical protein BU25DRAFT_319383, partial [Macroventuria anomochaeta]
IDSLDEIQHGSAQSSMVEWYIQDPFNAFLEDTLDGGQTDLGNLDTESFTRRFEHLSNFGGNMSQVRWMTTLLNAASHTKVPLPLVYAISVTWITIYVISVAVMFFAAVFSLVMCWLCHAPPILGY